MSDQLSSDLASLRISRDQGPPRGGLLKVILVLAVLGGLGAAVYFVGLPWVHGKFFKTEVAITEISEMSPAQAAVQLTSTGYVVPQHESKVGAKVVGRIAKVNVEEGDLVKAGSVVALLEDADQRSAVAAARSRVLAAKAKVQTARANLAEMEQQAKRERALVEKGVSPQATAQDLEARVVALAEQVRAADAEVRAAQAEAETIELTLSHMTILAPIDGTVVTKPLVVGELVGAGSSYIVEIADLSSLVVETDVPEGRLHLIKPNGPAEISLDAFPGKRYRGEVMEISPRVSRAKAAVTVKVKFTDAMTGVLPDMSARVNFLSAALDDKAVKEAPKIVVPGPAVADRDGAKVVFVVDDGMVRMTPVTLGPPFGDGFELQKGPAPGTRVVKNPPPKLSDGQKVKEKTEG